MKTTSRKTLLCLSEWLLSNFRYKIEHFSDWIYLGYSYKTFLALEKVLGHSGLMESFHERITKKAAELRHGYMKSISRISESNQTLSWHISEIAENNTMSNGLFMDTCYYSICLDILKEKEHSLLIIVDNHSLFDGLSRELKSSRLSGLNIYPKTKLSSYYFINFVKELLNQARSTLGFLKMMMYRKMIIWFYSGKSKPKFALENNILVHTFANDSCFGKAGIYKERYFGELIPKLQDSGYNTIYLIYLLYPRLSLRKLADIIKWCKASDSSFVFIEQIISVKDILQSLFVPFGLLRTKIHPINIGGVDLSYLIRRELHGECLSGRLRIPYLYFTFIKNLAARNGIRIKYLLDIYEGHILERTLRYSVRKFMPGCKTIGVSHTSFSRNHLSFFTSVTGPNYNLAPDFLLCTGNAYKNIFIMEGFKEEKVYVAGNLREDLPGSFYYNPASCGKRNRILVALPLLVNDAQELFWKAVQGFTGTEFKVSIYKHPVMSLEILSIMIEVQLPENIEFADEPASKGLSKCDLVITTGSNMSANALKVGLPVISVVRTIGLTFEPLDWFESPVSYCCTPDEIRDESFRLLSLSEEDLLKKSEMGKKVANTCLEPVNNRALNQFIKKSITTP